MLPETDFSQETEEMSVEQAISILRDHPHLIPNELIFKGLSRLVTREANGASIFSKSELDEYLAKHPEENFLLRIALDGYALTRGLRLIDDKLISDSIRDSRKTQADNKKRSWLSRVSRAMLNLDKAEVTALIREHERLAAEVVGLENKKLQLEHQTNELAREAGSILDKARSESQKISTESQTRSETLLRETRESIERMQKDSLAHIKSIHDEKSREIKVLEAKLEEMKQEIELKQTLISELSQNPDIVKEWEERRIPKPKPNITTFERAKEIMGSHLIEPEEAEKHLEFQYTDEERDKLLFIPWSEVELEELKDTHILVPGYALNILDIRARAPENTFRSYKDAWYNGEGFANQEKVQLRWYLIRKTIIPESTGKTYKQQLAFLSGQDENPRACEQVYAMVLYYLSRGQKLFSDRYARCRCLSSDGGRVDVYFYDGRLIIDGWDDDCAVGGLGLASSRLPAEARRA